MNRDVMLESLRSHGSKQWDVIVIGGGATGAGVAVDAATRGYKTLLVEREDFGKGTSSKSTKLVHGGVRYLEQGNLSLVMGALKERGILRRNAPHLVNELQFVVPNYSWWEAPFYGIGMKVYDLLATKYSFGKSRILSREETLEQIPNLRQDGLRGGVVYFDGQFDDARLLIHLIMTAADHGATVLNYASVTGFEFDQSGFVEGVTLVDRDSNDTYSVKARVIVNATGAFTDETRQLADKTAGTLVAPSQGIHLVLPHEFLRSESAIMVPHTSDGRVLFVIPWHDQTVIGTTDTPIESPSYEPRPMDEEIKFVLETAAGYLTRPPRREDILSIYVGIRPLVKAAGGDLSKTSALSRDHTIHIDPNGLLTIVGGKWTTYRQMAEDTVDHAVMLGHLPEVDCRTATLPIHGSTEESATELKVYGADAQSIRTIALESAEFAAPIHPALPYRKAEVIWAVREEMARTVEDVLARRTRALLLNAAAAIEAAPLVASLMAVEMRRGKEWELEQVRTFREMAKQYLPQPTQL